MPKVDWATVMIAVLLVLLLLWFLKKRGVAVAAT